MKEIVLLFPYIVLWTMLVIYCVEEKSECKWWMKVDLRQNSENIL
jgi:hypothetical protein